MFSSFLSMTSSFFSLLGDFILKIIASAGAVKCAFSWGMVVICSVALIFFLVRMRLKSALAVFLLLGASTFIYDFVGCNDCGSSAFLSHHFGSECPAADAEKTADMAEDNSSSHKGVCRDSAPGSAEKQSCK